jgi:L-fucose mutarotase/ribose pyranase (RbsD/FucU family)
MLKSIDPLLTADLLHTLRSMGHGDELVVADSNFPVASVAATTVQGTPIMLAGATMVDACRAILSVLPIDTFVDPAAWRMEVVAEPMPWSARPRNDLTGASSLRRVLFCRTAPRPDPCAVPRR